MITTGDSQDFAINTKLAQLTVVEVSNPRSPQPFPYTTTGAGLSNFSLAQDGVNPNAKVFTNLVPGQAYSVTQGAVSGWVTTLISCNDRSAANAADRTPVDLAARTILPNLQRGERLVCAFVNTQVAPGSISVCKVALGGDDTFAYTNSGGAAGSPNNPASFAIATASGSGGQVLTALALALSHGTNDAQDNGHHHPGVNHERISVNIRSAVLGHPGLRVDDRAGNRAGRRALTVNGILPLPIGPILIKNNSAWR